MRKVLLSVVATVILYTALAGCASDQKRALVYCGENYFGYTKLECEHKMRQRYSR